MRVLSLFLPGIAESPFLHYKGFLSFLQPAFFIDLSRLARVFFLCYDTRKEGQAWDVREL